MQTLRQRLHSLLKKHLAFTTAATYGLIPTHIIGILIFLLQSAKVSLKSKLEIKYNTLLCFYLMLVVHASQVILKVLVLQLLLFDGFGVLFLKQSTLLRFGVRGRFPESSGILYRLLQLLLQRLRRIRLHL